MEGWSTRASRRCSRHSALTALWRGFRRARCSRRCTTASTTRWSAASNGTAFASAAHAGTAARRSRVHGQGGVMNARGRRMGRLLVVVLIGLLLGALLSELAIRFMPDSAARTFFTTSVAAAFGPLVVDLVAVGFT